MSLSIKIVPVHNSLHMYGDPNRSSAYSLSGHVQITLSPHFLNFKSSKVLLQSLELTFEGQSEVSAPSVGYAAVRLCAITTELVPHEHPVLLSGDGDDCPGGICQWNAIFNINVPGWLPASSCFGTDDSGVSYQLSACAKYVDAENRKGETPSHHRSSSSSSSSSWFFNNICAAVYSSQRTATADHSISISRFFGLPSEDAPRPASLITYLMNGDKISCGEVKIPSDVLSKIRILASVPEYLDMQETRASLTLRLRTKDLPAEECKRLQLVGFRVDILQKDKCRSQPSREYKSRYSIPGEELQPPNLPLRWTQRSPLSMNYFTRSDSPNASCSRTFSLLPATEDGQYMLQNDNYIFADDAEQGDIPTWYTLQTNIPLVNHVPGDDEDESNEWAGERTLRPTNTTGPLITVQHEARIALFLSYDVPDSMQKAHQKITFSVPIKFAPTAPRVSKSRRQLHALMKSSLSTSRSAPSPSGRHLDASPTTTHFRFDETHDSGEHCSSPMLPPYSQLYHINGDRKIDPTPLPVYTPRGSLDKDSAAPTQSSNIEQRRPVAVPSHFPVFTQKAHNVA
ncbi:hypothetical protein FB446DRAFT_730812 [Lentinula raphanica]|nr:hypothetical protein FB446DRAFT_730812 [Lentinula raphanica]KAJ3822480.1 hypothetical protein F5880DRAFT_1483985 [Lentinula raphanica]